MRVWARTAQIAGQPAGSASDLSGALAVAREGGVYSHLVHAAVKVVWG